MAARAARSSRPLPVVLLATGSYVFVVLTPALSISDGAGRLAIAGWTVLSTGPGLLLTREDVSAARRT